jgi:dienelactone hydrolase
MDHIGAIGFCFGGMCVLDLARDGTDLAGVVSFHGILNPPNNPKKGIRAKILACHGFDDPMVPPDVVLNFQREMTDSGADWQMHIYGDTVHAFTNPNAHDPGFGTVYNKLAEARSWLAMRNFFKEIFLK